MLFRTLQPARTNLYLFKSLLMREDLQVKTPAKISRIYATKPDDGLMLNFSTSVAIAKSPCVSGSLFGISPLFKIDEGSKTKSGPFKNETAF